MAVYLCFIIYGLFDFDSINLRNYRTGHSLAMTSFLILLFSTTSIVRFTRFVLRRYLKLFIFNTLE